ncbi:MAG: SIR2 family protein [Steroidobacteraceae bacterium]
MIKMSTVVVLGAGASVPYGFPTGRELLGLARQYGDQELKKLIFDRGYHRGLHQALHHTGNASIDAMLEYNSDLVPAGKCLIAALLLKSEHEMHLRRHPRLENCSEQEKKRIASEWFEILFEEMGAPKLCEFKENQVTFVTYNYDRVLEYKLQLALQVKYSPASVKADDYRDALGGTEIIHLHGQLGFLRTWTDDESKVVGFGAGVVDPANDIFDKDKVFAAADAIKIMHESEETSEELERARQRISEADRVVFLGFGYAEQNLKRLQLQGTLKDNAALYLCRLGMTDSQFEHQVAPFLQDRASNLRIGKSDEDIVGFLVTVRSGHVDTGFPRC